MPDFRNWLASLPFVQKWLLELGEWYKKSAVCLLPLTDHQRGRKRIVIKRYNNVHKVCTNRCAVVSLVNSHVREDFIISVVVRSIWSGWCAGEWDIYLVSSKLCYVYHHGNACTFYTCICVGRFCPLYTFVAQMQYKYTRVTYRLE